MANGDQRNLMDIFANALQAQQEQNKQVLAELVTQLRNTGISQNGRRNEEDRDENGRTPNQAGRLALDFIRHCPTFERGKDRWTDFSSRFLLQKETYKVEDTEAKIALWNAIVGRSSRIVISSMHPKEGVFGTMDFAQYLTTMGQKFTPASESMQMKSEYKSRVQGKTEDVQNYINEKYELYKLAYPGVNDMADFYMEATKGVANKYVRNNLWGHRATSVENYGEMAVFWVQVERQRVAYGDSEGTNMDGLVPVTRNPHGGKGEPMEIDHLRRTYRDEPEEDDPEDCECMAMHEQGFKGPCYYCRKRGHVIRNCPRKSAGLPRTHESGPAGSFQNKTKWNQKGRGGMSNTRGTFTKKRINNVVDQTEEKAEEEEEGRENPEEENDEIDFLGETTL